jgi:hypothetical protein
VRRLWHSEARCVLLVGDLSIGRAAFTVSLLLWSLDKCLSSARLVDYGMTSVSHIYVELPGEGGYRLACTHLVGDTDKKELKMLRNAPLTLLVFRANIHNIQPADSLSPK